MAVRDSEGTQGFADEETSGTHR